jgi:hypothetical protein
VTLTAPWNCVPASAPQLLVRSGRVLEHDAAVIVTVTAMVLGVQGQDPVTETVAVVPCVTMAREV